MMDNAVKQRQFISDCGRYINTAKASFGPEYQKPVLASSLNGFFYVQGWTVCHKEPWMAV
jgi:hypothetical protein